MPTAQRKRFEISAPNRAPISGLAPRIRLDSAISEYLADLTACRSAKAAYRSRFILADFRKFCSKRYLHAINRRDLVTYMTALRDRRLADRTIFNRMSALLSFFRACGIEGLISRRDLPRYTQKPVDAYSDVELAQLLRAANKRERAIFGFFLSTGCRELISRFPAHP